MIMIIIQMIVYNKNNEPNLIHYFLIPIYIT